MPTKVQLENGRIIEFENKPTPEDIDFAVEQMGKVQSQEAPKKSIGGFAKNVVKSGGDFVGGVASTVMHPVRTAKGIGNIVLGGVEKLIPGEQPQEGQFNALVDLYKQRYGGLNNIKETAYQDPVGVASDLAALLGGVGGVTSKVGNLTKLGKVADVGQKISNVSNVVNPLKTSMITKPATKFAENVAIRSPQVAGRIINSIIKPSTKELSYGKNPGLTVAKEGIIGNNLDDLSKNIGLRVGAVGQEIKNTVSSVKTRMNIQDSVKPVEDAIIKAREFPNTNATLITRLEGIKDDLLGIVRNDKGQITKRRNLLNVSPLEATELKTKIGDLTKWTGNISDDNVVNGALKKTYGSLKIKIGNTVPAVKPLNEKYADLLSAKIATEHRANLTQKQNLMGLTTIEAGLGTGLVTAIVTGGSSVKATIAGLSAVAITKALQSPAVMTRVARGLAKSKPIKIQSTMNKLPQLKKALVGMLNNNEIKLPAGVIQILREQD